MSSTIERGVKRKATNQKQMKEENGAIKCAKEDKPVKDEKESESDAEDSDSDIEDPFVDHFGKEGLSASDLENLANKNVCTEVQSWPVMGDLQNTYLKDTGKNLKRGYSLDQLKISPCLIENIPAAIKHCKGLINTNGNMSPLQMELLNLISSYKDLLSTERSLLKGEEIRLVYCLHALNHVLKARRKLLHHNLKIKRKTNKTEPISEKFRDQGLTRAKVLFLVPFRESAVRIVNLLITFLLKDSKKDIYNKKRFKDEFCSEEETNPNRKGKKKPDDYLATFAGNIDDAFKIGIGVSRRSIKLYADFYSADIIIASPLGLRTVIGAEGEKDRDFDFLSSIEILILDQTDIFLMQNWEHVLHLFQHLNLHPTDSHGADFSRARMWVLDGHAKHYRQTLAFSALSLPQIRALFTKFCTNFEGTVITSNLVAVGSSSQVVVDVPQMFHRFASTSVVSSPTDRFEFFTTKILPNFKDSHMSQTLVFIPSYFDFVTLRNYFNREDLKFKQICEYTKDGKVAKARDMFFHGTTHFLLYTERAHFYHRYIIKGLKHILFYQLPLYPNFYSEITNWLKTEKEYNHISCTSIYNKYDIQQLSAIVGHARASHMLYSDKKLHMFVTEKS